MGHEVACIAINDKFVSKEDRALKLTESEDGRALSIIRLSKSITWSERLDYIQDEIIRYKPGWISLQYVPYGFHPKGLPIGLGKRLGRLKGNFLWHIMFHETWVGEGDAWLKPNRYYGAVQKRIAAGIHRRLKAVCSSTNPFHYRQLNSIGCPNTILPLFGNLRLSVPNPELRSMLIKGAGIEADEAEVWIFGFFGTLHAEWSPKDLIPKILSLESRAGKKRSLFVSLGGMGDGGEKIWTEMKCRYGDRLSFAAMGRLSESLVSEYLHCADFGIATSPMIFLGKSGSAAAMLDHGLPVIVTRMEGTRFQDSYPSSLIPLDNCFETKILTAQKRSPRSDLAEITALFLKELSLPIPQTSVADDGARKETR